MSLVQGSIAKGGKGGYTGLCLLSKIETADTSISVVWTRESLMGEERVSNSYQESDERENWNRPDRPLERAFRCGSHVNSVLVWVSIRVSS